MTESHGRTLGQHIASRLVEIGVETFFAVPGDFNLVLLDQLIKEPRLHAIYTCNELNAGYAADGYARAKGAGCCVATFTVGGLSLINAVAGAYSENLPLIVITGGPNSNDFGTNRILHHTIGVVDFHQELRCFREITCHQVVIQNLDDAFSQIDTAISQALQQSKPVYINVCCNLAGLPHPSFAELPVPFSMISKASNPQSLEAAVNAALDFLNPAVKPVIVAGVKVKVGKAQKELVELANASQYAVSIMPNAKGMFPEDHGRFLGTYWGHVSSPCCAEIVESSDAYIFVGPIFNDYSSVGYSMLISTSKMIQVEPSRVVIRGARTFGCVLMKDFLRELAKKVKANNTAFVNYERMYVATPEVSQSPSGSPLRTNVLFKHIQTMLSSKTSVLAETGDSWFNCQKLKLPEGCGFEFQMQYGSIGWAVGATLGQQAALQGQQRVIACIGDGSFQVTAQDISTIIRYGYAPVVFLINNGGYTIEVEIHDGPYNIINNWNYTALVEAFTNSTQYERNVVTAKVRTEEELVSAIKLAQTEAADSFVFIECFLHKDDCSKELLEWGSRVATANGRPPNPQ